MINRWQAAARGEWSWCCREISRLQCQLAQTLQDNGRLLGENDRLWRFLADEAPIRELPEWMRDKIVERERAEREARASDDGDDT